VLSLVVVRVLLLGVIDNSGGVILSFLFLNVCIIDAFGHLVGA
jgi:hypothetical protein